jgi:ribosomal protein L15E
MKRKPKVRMGRPPKADKFDAQIAFQCWQWMKDAVESHRVANGLRSEGDAMRDLIKRGTKAKPPSARKP